MPKQVLDVGQCVPDHTAIRNCLESNFDVQITRTHLPDDTFAALRQAPFDLVLINRKLDADYTDGLDILKRIKADAQLAHIPVMLVTNYPEHQQEAVAAGGALGFGKAELDKPDTLDRLSDILGPTKR